MALSIIFTTYTRNNIALKSCRVNEATTLLKKRPEACNFIKKGTQAQVFSCEFCEISESTFCHRTPPVAASVCCRTKVAVDKIEKLKAFIIKHYDISKTYSVQFHLFYSVNLPYFYFFIHGFQSPILHKLKNTLTCWLKLSKDNNRSFLVAYST